MVDVESRPVPPTTVPGRSWWRQLSEPGWYLWLSTFVLLGFILIPLLAIFARGFEDRAILDPLNDPVVQDALTLSLLTSVMALGLSLLIGTPVAYLLARHRFPGHQIIDTLIDLPIVLPPAVAGVALLMAFGRRGILGPFLSDTFGVELPFTIAAVVIAQTFVAIPFYVKSAQAGFQSVDADLLQVAATLGISRFEIFRSVTVPLALPALVGGAVMTWARALGEFGATLLFAGNFAGRTQTMPLAIFQTLESGSLNAALALSAILIVVSFSVLIIFRTLARATYTGTVSNA